MLRKPERSAYTPLDFLQWQEAGTLVISPKFQRRGVWSRAAQSFLIDTLLLELPVPPIYLRVVQNPSKRSMIREVIDGQQRVSSVLQYMNDKFPLTKNIESPCAGKRFSELSDSQKDKISQFSFVCEVFYGVEDADVLKIFSRLNTHSVKLNAQELRNGKYFGQFKQTAYGLALEHLEFWRRTKIFTEQAIARMNEVELTSELMIAMIAGIQDKKKSIDSFYEKNDEIFPEKSTVSSRLKAVIDVVNEVLWENFDETEFRRVPLFYSLFLAIHHRLFGLPGQTALSTPATGRLSRAEVDGLESAILKLSDAVRTAKDDMSNVPQTMSAFVNACIQQTDNIRPRETRFRTVYETAFT